MDWKTAKIDAHNVPHIIMKKKNKTTENLRRGKSNLITRVLISTKTKIAVR